MYQGKLDSCTIWKSCICVSYGALEVFGNLFISCVTAFLLLTADNRLTGSIPSELGFLTGLTLLDLRK
jgi:hypothetical protein